MLELVPASAADIPEVRRLAEIIWREHYPSVISVAQIEYMLEKMYSEESLLQEMQSGTRFDFIAQNGQNLGFMGYRPELDDRAMYLSKLYLLPACHGQGIGKYALERLQDIAKEEGLDSLYLYVNKRNVKAIQAYQRFGMASEAEMVRDIGQGYVMDDYRMRKSF